MRATYSVLTQTITALVVQRIGRKLAELAIEVRFLSRAFANMVRK